MAATASTASGAHSWSMTEVKNGLATMLREVGVSQDDAHTAAVHMVEGTARGQLHHGVERIFEALEGLRSGVLCAAPKRRVLRSACAFAVLSGGYGLGAPAAGDAVRIARKMSVHAGIAAVGLVDAGHLGMLAPWAEAIASGGNVGVVMSTTSPAAVFPGGRTALLGTNPIAYAFEIGDETLSADFSTTSITRGALLEYHDSGKPIPDGVAVDEYGANTREPEAALRGGLLPIGGGLKGALVNLLVSVLAGPAIGAVANDRITGTRWMSAPPNKGDFFLAINLDLLTDHTSFGEEMGRLLDRLSADAPGFHCPGAGARRRRADAVRLGIPVSERLNSELIRLKRARWP